jgi:hypothetical protein
VHRLLTVGCAVRPVVGALKSSLTLLAYVQRVHRVPQAVDGVLELRQVIDYFVLWLSEHLSRLCRHEVLMLRPQHLAACLHAVQYSENEALLAARPCRHLFRRVPDDLRRHCLRLHQSFIRIV